jgi:hypothetical protein
MIGRFLILLVIIFYSSCYKKQDGCLDLLSSNFDALADEPCDGCCTYPAIVMSLESISGTDSTFSLGDTIINNLGVRLRLLESKLYLSNFKIAEKANSYRSSLRIKDVNDVAYIDDIVFLRPQDRSISIGGFRFAGLADSISYDIGLQDSIFDNRFTSLPTTHPINPLNLITDTIKNQTAIGRFRFVYLDAPAKDTLTIHLAAAPHHYPFRLAHNKQNNQGASIEMKMIADYKRLFDDITIVPNAVDVEKTIRKNIYHFFYVR